MATAGAEVADNVPEFSSLEFSSLGNPLVEDRSHAVVRGAQRTDLGEEGPLHVPCFRRVRSRGDKEVDMGTASSQDYCYHGS